MESVLMNTYAIILNYDVSIVVIKAEYYQIIEGFVRFYIDTEEGGCEEFASYAAESVASVVKQKEYTEAEVIAQIEGGKDRYLHIDEDGRVAEVGVNDISMSYYSWPTLLKVSASGGVKVWGMKDGVETWYEVDNENL